MFTRTGRVGHPINVLATLAVLMLLTAVVHGQDMSKSIQIEVPVVNLLKGKPLAGKQEGVTAVLEWNKQAFKKLQLVVPDQPSLGKSDIESPVESLLVEMTKVSEPVSEQPDNSNDTNPAVSNINTIEAGNTRADSNNPSVEPGLVNWHSDLTAAALQSKISGKPVFHFQLLGQLDHRFT